MEPVLQFGMPTLIENRTLQENISLCRRNHCCKLRIILTKPRIIGNDLLLDTNGFVQIVNYIIKIFEIIVSTTTLIILKLCPYCCYVCITYSRNNLC